jgi:hypothetical protein
MQKVDQALQRPGNGEPSLRDVGRSLVMLNCRGQNMNTAAQIAVTLAALIGFGRIFLADEGASHRLSGYVILAGLLGKIALAI